MTECDVDLVYSWCDDADAGWRAKRMALAARYGVVSSQAENGACRYRGGDMLRYSLRSAAACAPWLRRVFIIADDDQTIPAWPELADPKISIVRHSEIIPAEFLPTFCADVIEHHVFRIPGLADRFLYANDDTLFWEKTDRSFFFAPDGFPFFRFGAKRKPAANEVEKTYRAGQELADGLMRSRLGMRPGPRSPVGRLSHHNIDAYVKSDCIACYEAFKDAIEPHLAYPFRNTRIVHRTLYAGWAVANGHGHFRRATFNTNRASAWWRRLLPAWADSLQIPPGKWRPGPEQIARFRPKLVCFNDGPDTPEEDFDWLRALLEEKFPALAQGGAKP